MTVHDTAPIVDKIPTAAWALAWLFLVGQCVELVARGPNSSDLPWVVASMALTALVVYWFADGVLRGRTARLVIVWIILSAATSLGLVGLLIEPAEAETTDLISCAFTVAQLIALGVFCSSDYFTTQRSRQDAPRSTLAPLLMIAVATGLLGGLTAPDGSESAPIHLRIGL
ncbi:hypothetical protein [Mumia zhuanghuii]|uniref:hypothetical protein n=1 Tax=Mumia zhuanghuii TaxID=2585211 RepID=UPI0036391A4A